MSLLAAAIASLQHMFEFVIRIVTTDPVQGETSQTLRCSNSEMTVRREPTAWSVHADADCQQDIGESLLVGGLDCQDMVRRGHRIVEVPLLDRFEF
mgnify:CR=1 FL=1